MSSMDRFVRWLTGEEEVAGIGSTQAGSRAADELPAPENDAEPYGVTVEAAAVTAGTHYWRVIRVHHLSSDENMGRHHIYIDAKKADGSRAFNSQVYITWEGGEHTATLDKPLNEPATNFPLFKWQKCSLEMRGMASDKVHGLSSSHPDEPNPDGTQSGNTLFHHSFLVIFQETTAPEPVTTGTIQGRVENSRDGLAVELKQAGNSMAFAAVTADDTFVFHAVAAGGYTLHLAEQSIPVQVQAGETAKVVLVLAETESVIEGTVHGGGGLTLRLVQGADATGEVMAEGPLGQSGSYRVRNLGAGIYHVQVWRAGENKPVVESGALAMDGRNRRTVELTVPVPGPTPEPDPVTEPDPIVPPVAPANSGSPLDHYVLFSSTNTPETQAQLMALAPRLAEKNLGFGFDYQEAARARRVTAVGNGHLIPEFQLIFLSSRGVQVRRLTGTPEEMAKQL